MQQLTKESDNTSKNWEPGGECAMGIPQLVLRLSCCVKKGAIGFSCYRCFQVRFEFNRFCSGGSLLRSIKALEYAHLQLLEPFYDDERFIEAFAAVVGLIGISNQIMYFSASMVCQSGTYRKVMTQVYCLKQPNCCATLCDAEPDVLWRTLSSHCDSLSREARYSSGEI